MEAHKSIILYNYVSVTCVLLIMHKINIMLNMYLYTIREYELKTSILV